MATFTDADVEDALAYVMNNVLHGAAAGTCRDAKLAGRFAEAGMSIVGHGSWTTQKRDGNPGDNFYFDEETGNSINAWGIPNLGIDEGMPEIKKSRAQVRPHGAKLWVSASAGNVYSPDDYGTIASRLENSNAADVVEGNFSCGNMKEGDHYKPIVCYDDGAFDAGVEALVYGAGSLKTAVKLTPTTERRFLISNIETCLRYNVDYIVLSNTVPNCYLEKPDGTAAISMELGGGGGAMLIPIVTGMLRMSREVTRGTRTKLIAAGGVSCGKVAYHYLKHGAHGYVYASELWRRNFDPRIDQEIIMGDESRSLPGLVQYLVKYGLPK